MGGSGAGQSWTWRRRRGAKRRGGRCSLGMRAPTRTMRWPAGGAQPPPSTHSPHMHRCCRVPPPPSVAPPSTRPLSRRAVANARRRGRARTVPGADGAAVGVDPSRRLSAATPCEKRRASCPRPARLRIPASTGPGKDAGRRRRAGRTVHELVPMPPAPTPRRGGRPTPRRGGRRGGCGGC